MKDIKEKNIHMTFEEISVALNIPENEVKKIYKVAIRKLKHPKYFKYFKDFIYEDFSSGETNEKYDGSENTIRD